MPFPFLPILAGLASATGIGAGAYGLGTSIKDRNAMKKKEKADREAFAKKQAANAQLMKQKQALNKPGITNALSGVGQSNPGFTPSGAGFTPSAQPNSFWNGQPAGVETFNQYTPEQQAAFSQILQQALSGIGQNKFDFAPIENQARQGFAEQTIPGIAERFSKLGAQKSSAFGQQLGAAGAGLEGNLAAQKQGYNLQQQQMLQKQMVQNIFIFQDRKHCAGNARKMCQKVWVSFRCWFHTRVAG